MPEFTNTSFIYSAQGFMPPDSGEIHSQRLEQYLSLFPVRTGTTYKRAESPSWRPMSQFHSLTDEEIGDSLQDKPAFIRACPLGKRSKFAVLGIPADSIYSNPERISVIIDLLRNLGLSPVIYGSASCDEIQIYLFFDKEMKTKLIADALKSLLIRCGLKLEKNLIIYCEDSTLVLPLQQGFSWLNDSLQIKVCRDQISFESALAMFCADMDKFQSSLDALLELHSHTRTVVELDDSEKSQLESENIEQWDFTPPIADVIAIIEEPALVLQPVPADESNCVQHEQIDFAPEQVIDMTPSEEPMAQESKKKALKGFPYISDFTQLLLPIPGAEGIEPAREIEASTRKSRRSKRRRHAT